MKKITFLIATILYSLNVLSQQVALNNVVGIDLPNGAQKITKEQALAHAGKKFNNDKMVLNSYANMHTGRILYKFDDIVISLKAFDTTFKFKKGHAEELKKGLDEMARRSTSYTSILKTINNNSIVVTNFINGGAEYYYFYCFNANNTREMTGSLVFDKADKDKATAILDHVLNSIKFKD